MFKDTLLITQCVLNSPTSIFSHIRSQLFWCTDWLRARLFVDLEAIRRHAESCNTNFHQVSPGGYIRVTGTELLHHKHIRKSQYFQTHVFIMPVLCVGTAFYQNIAASSNLAPLMWSCTLKIWNTACPDLTIEFLPYRNLYWKINAILVLCIITLIFTIVTCVILTSRLHESLHFIGIFICKL